jgi:hypothetical protein
MKVCFKCGEKKNADEFYRHPQMGDGRLGKCKECTKRDVAENYQGKRKYYAKYEKARFQKPERKAAALEYQRKRRARYPEIYRANNAVSNAIRCGRLVPEPCERCGAKAQAHHEDYSRPLDVQWLCRLHHLQRHGKVAYE